jgi:hypothetical protein
MKLGRAADLIAENAHETLIFYDFPDNHGVRIPLAIANGTRPNRDMPCANGSGRT